MNEWISKGQISDKSLVTSVLTSDPTDHPDNHRLRWQDPADVDGAVIISWFCSAGDLLLRSASCESNTHIITPRLIAFIPSQLQKANANRREFSTSLKLCVCVCSGHPRVRFCPESSGAASTETFWKKEEPSCQPHPGKHTHMQRKHTHFTSVEFCCSSWGPVWKQYKFPPVFVCVMSVLTDSKPFTVCLCVCPLFTLLECVCVSLSAPIRVKVFH